MRRCGECGKPTNGAAKCNECLGERDDGDREDS